MPFDVIFDDGTTNLTVRERILRNIKEVLEELKTAGNISDVVRGSKTDLQENELGRLYIYEGTENVEADETALNRRVANLTISIVYFVNYHDADFATFINEILGRVQNKIGENLHWFGNSTGTNEIGNEIIYPTRDSSIGGFFLDIVVTYYRFTKDSTLI